MANEAQIAVSLIVTQTRGVTTPYQAAYSADVSTPRGPTPGIVLADTNGQEVSLSLLYVPGLAWFHNLSEDHYVEIGIQDPDTGKYYPMLELLPEEAVVVRLSRFIREEYASTPGTGTGTSAAPSNKLYVRCPQGTAYVRCEVYEK